MSGGGGVGELVEFGGLVGVFGRGSGGEWPTICECTCAKCDRTRCMEGRVEGSLCRTKLRKPSTCESTRRDSLTRKWLRNGVVGGGFGGGGVVVRDVWCEVWYVVRRCGVRCEAGLVRGVRCVVRCGKVRV